MEDNETTFPELITRLKETITYLKTLTPEQIDGAQTKFIRLPIGEETLTCDGQSFLL